MATESSFVKDIVINFLRFLSQNAHFVITLRNKLYYLVKSSFEIPPPLILTSFMNVVYELHVLHVSAYYFYWAKNPQIMTIIQLAVFGDEF